MAKPFTHEQREELKARIIGLVRKNERMTISQLERATGAGWHSVRRCLVDVLACGDLYMPGNTVFLHQNRCIAYGVRQRRKQPTRH